MNISGALYKYKFAFSQSGEFKGYEVYSVERILVDEQTYTYVYNEIALINSYNEKLKCNNFEQQGTTNTYLSYDSIKNETSFKFGENGDIYTVYGEFEVDSATGLTFTRVDTITSGITKFVVSDSNVVEVEYIQDGYTILDKYTAGNIEIICSKGNDTVTMNYTGTMISLADFQDNCYAYSNAETITDKPYNRYQAFKINYNSKFALVNLTIAEENVGTIVDCTSIQEDSKKYYGANYLSYLEIEYGTSTVVKYDLSDGSQFNGVNSTNKTCSIDDKQFGYTLYNFANKTKFVFTSKEYVISIPSAGAIVTDLIPFNYTGSYDYLIKITDSNSYDHYFIYSSGEDVTTSYSGSIALLQENANVFGLTANFYQIYNNVNEVNEYLLVMKKVSGNIITGQDVNINSSFYTGKTYYNNDDGNIVDNTTNVNKLARSEITINNGYYVFTDSLMNGDANIATYVYKLSSMNVSFVKLPGDIDGSSIITEGYDTSENSASYSSLVKYFMTISQAISPLGRKTYAGIDIFGQFKCDLIEMPTGYVEISNIDTLNDFTIENGNRVYTIETTYNGNIKSIKINIDKKVSVDEIEVILKTSPVFTYQFMRLKEGASENSTNIDDYEPESTAEEYRYPSIMALFIELGQ